MLLLDGLGIDTGVSLAAPVVQGSTTPVVPSPSATSVPAFDAADGVIYLLSSDAERLVPCAKELPVLLSGEIREDDALHSVGGDEAFTRRPPRSSPSSRAR